MAPSRRLPRSKPACRRAGEYVFEPDDGWVDEAEASQAHAGPADAPVVASSSKAVVVGRETKGRKGAGVTVVRGLQLGDDVLATLARELKQMCATGGTVRGGTIELQGEHRDRVVAELVGRGWAARRSGA